MKQFDLQEEFEAVNFNSKRLKERFIKTMEKLKENASEVSILSAMGSRSEAKAVYRMLGNERFSYSEIQRSHKASTLERIINSHEKTILAIQDTTSVNYGTHKKTKGIGYNSHKTRGLNVHSSIAVTPEGITLGILHQHCYTRENRKQEGTKEERKSREIEEKESFRWLETMELSNKDVPEQIKMIHICDREGDMYELYEKAISEKKSFLIRVTQNRYSHKNEKIVNEIKKEPFKGSLDVTIPRDSRTNTPKRNATLSITYKRFKIKVPKRHKKNSEMAMNVIYVTETKNDDANQGIEWILATNEAIDSPEDAFTYVGYYVQRWKIERFHYVLKSGCQVEKIQQRDVQQIIPLIFMYSIISTMILNMTYLARVQPDLPCSVIFEKEEADILYCCIHKTKSPPEKSYSLEQAIRYLGELGGFKSSKSDGAPGLKRIWMGLQKLYFLQQFRAFL